MSPSHKQCISIFVTTGHIQRYLPKIYVQTLVVLPPCVLLGKNMLSMLDRTTGHHQSMILP